MTNAQGPAPDTRIAAIDMVRGFAVLGILAMNIVSFALPGDAYVDPSVAGGNTGADLWTWAAATLVFDGKMRALFAILFGTSILLMAGRGPPAGVTRRHMARMIVLLLIGAGHAWFVWSGDILVPYALLGMLLFAWRGLEAHKLFGLAVVLLALQAAIAFSAAAALTSPVPTDAFGEVASPAADRMAAVIRETAAMRGSWAEVQQQRARATWNMWTVVIPLGSLLETAGLILLGMGLYRAGWWSESRASSARRVMLFPILPLAFAAGAILPWRYAALAFRPADFFWMEGVRILIGPVVAVGYSALLIYVVKKFRLRWLGDRLAAAGRMALSNYLLTSLVMTTIFYGYGLGLFDEIRRAMLWLPVAAMWLAMLGWSKPWLDRFAYGPCEWAWRSLARGRRQAFVRDRAEGTPR